MDKGQAHGGPKPRWSLALHRIRYLTYQTLLSHHLTICFSFSTCVPQVLSASPPVGQHEDLDHHARRSKQHDYPAADIEVFHEPGL